MKALDKLRNSARFLKDGGIEASEKEAQILINRGLDIDMVEIYRDNPEFSKEQAAALDKMIQRRLAREPLQYILGYDEFLGIKVFVGPGVLIPRPETELMAALAIKKIRTKNSEHRTQTTDYGKRFTVLDLCTGSGCIALAIAKEFPDAEVFGSDISETSVRYAKENAEINRIKNISFVHGPFFEPFETGPQLLFDLIISNPPYITADDIKSLQPEIRLWEPETALNGGPDGLDLYRKLIPSANRFLKPDGLIMLEIGYSQARDVKAIMRTAGYSRIKTIKDLSGIERIIQAQWIR